MRRQDGGTNEHGINTIDRGNLIDRLDCSTALDLHDYADVVVCNVEVVSDGPVAIASLTDRYATHAERRVTCRGDGPLRISGAINERDEEVEKACIQHALNDNAVICRWPHERRARAVFQCHEPAGAAIVNALGQIRQVVAPGVSTERDRRRYLVIAPQVAGKAGAVVQVQAL